MQNGPNDAKDGNDIDSSFQIKEETTFFKSHIILKVLIDFLSN